MASFRFQIRSDTAANWTSVNPKLLQGELAIETDTRKFKIGNGVDAWKNLLYATQGEEGPPGSQGDPITVVSTSIDASGNTVILFSDGNEVTVAKGVDGDDGTSVTVSSTGYDAAGNTVVYFSDGKTATVSKGRDGEDGDTGDTWKPSVTAGGDLSWTKDSGATTPTQQNIKGNTGDTWRPTVSAAGDLTWTKDSGATTPTVRNIKGADGISPSLSPIAAYTETLVATTGTINLNNGNVFEITPTAATTFSITNAKAGAHSFTLIVNQGATPKALTFPNSVKWMNGNIPVTSTANKTYLFTFLTTNSGTTWLGTFGGEF